MKGASFCIHRTCLCHWVFELPLSHLSQCSVIHFIFLTLGMDALSPPRLRLYRPWVLSLHCVICALTRMSEVVIFKFNSPSTNSILCHIMTIFFFRLPSCWWYHRCFIWLICVIGWHFLSLFSPVPPAIHEIKSHGIGLGRTALLRCEAAAVPSPTFEWYKGEKRCARFDYLGHL